MKGGVKNNPKINRYPAARRNPPHFSIFEVFDHFKTFPLLYTSFLKILLMRSDNFHVQHFFATILVLRCITDDPLKNTWVVGNGVRMRSPALEALGRSLRGETGLAPSALTSLAQKVIACAVYLPEENQSLQS